MFGWLIAVVGIIPWVFAYRAIQCGEVRVGDQVRQTRYSRADNPTSFWSGVAFYIVFGIVLMVLGVLAGLGILR